MNRDRLVDNTGLLEQARATKHARIVMRLADLDVLVRLIKVWGSVVSRVGRKEGRKEG